MLSVSAIVTIYVCVTNPIIPMTIYGIGKYIFLKTISKKEEKKKGV